MDLGIAGRTALVCGASRGLGRACALALAREDVAVTIVARHEGPLAEAATALRAETGARITAVAADIATEAGRAAALAALPAPDILVTNAGGPPPGDFRQWSREDWIAALDANMLAPIALIRATMDAMMARGFGRIINITSAAVKQPIDSLPLSNGARAGLTGVIAGIARQTIAQGVTINNLLPGPFETGRLRETMAGEAKASGRTLEAVIDDRRRSNPAKRFGNPDEFGAACAFLASAHAGFITGQNLVLDGGAYRGTL